MADKPTYEELEQKVKELEKEVVKHKWTKKSLIPNADELDLFDAESESPHLVDGNRQGPCLIVPAGVLDTKPSTRYPANSCYLGESQARSETSILSGHARDAPAYPLPGSAPNGLLKNCWAGSCGVKIRLKMLIYCCDN